MADLDVVVVGAGLAGLYAVKALRDAGLTVRAFEAGSGIGGTWFWNCYPGARCDVESRDYSYSFSPELQKEWTWSERYPAQPEVLRYLHHVADRFGLWPDIQLSTTVTAASWEGGAWTVLTDDGASRTARYVVSAVGCLSAPAVPALPGLADFTGAWYQTARWPAGGADFTGQRVAVIGTGSTGIQVSPEIAASASHLYVFQRTAHFAVPNRNAPISAAADAEMKASYEQYRAAARESILGVPITGTGRSALEASPQEREALYTERWNAGGGMPFLAGTYADLLVSRDANDTVAEFIRDRIRSIVADPSVAERLCPRTYPVGAKRLAQSDDYYAMFNLPNVTLVDVRSAPISSVTATGLVTADGTSYDVDSIVFATGFDAISGALDRISVTGPDGVTLRSAWSCGPRAYLGIMTAGFPNLFIVTGPGSPSVFSNMVLSIEQHVEWIRDCLVFLRSRGLSSIEALPAAQDAWVDHTQQVAYSTLFPLADSWYVGANIPGKPRVFSPYVGGVGPYRARCDEVVAAGYEGFAVS